MNITTGFQNINNQKTYSALVSVAPEVNAGAEVVFDKDNLYNKTNLVAQIGVEEESMWRFNLGMPQNSSEKATLGVGYDYNLKKQFGAQVDYTSNLGSIKNSIALQGIVRPFFLEEISNEVDDSLSSLAFQPGLELRKDSATSSSTFGTLNVSMNVPTFGIVDWLNVSHKFLTPNFDPAQKTSSYTWVGIGKQMGDWEVRASAGKYTHEEPWLKNFNNPDVTVLARLTF